MFIGFYHPGKEMGELVLRSLSHRGAYNYDNEQATCPRYLTQWLGADSNLQGTEHNAYTVQGRSQAVARYYVRNTLFSKRPHFPTICLDMCKTSNLTVCRHLPDCFCSSRNPTEIGQRGGLVVTCAAARLPSEGSDDRGSSPDQGKNLDQDFLLHALPYSAYGPQVSW